RPQKKLRSEQSQALVRPGSSEARGDHPAALRIDEVQVAVLFAALNFAPLCFKTKWKRKHFKKLDRLLSIICTLMTQLCFSFFKQIPKSMANEHQDTQSYIFKTINL